MVLRSLSVAQAKAGLVMMMPTTSDLGDWLRWSWLNGLYLGLLLGVVVGQLLTLALRARQVIELRAIRTADDY